MPLKEILENKKIGFFFGAGISIPSGIPRLGSCERIINCMLCPSYASELFSLGGKEEKEIYRFVIECAAEEQRKRLSCRYPIMPNNYGGFYEDVIDILERNSTYGDDLKTLSYTKDLREKVVRIKDTYPTYWDGIECRDENFKIEKIFKDTVLYMKKIFISMIYTDDDFDIQGYDLIKFFHEQIKDEFDIYSLNNDLLMETFLNKNGISFKDGFPESGIFNGDFDGKVRYLKIHGSISDQFEGAKIKRFRDSTLMREAIDKTEYPSKILMGTNIKPKFYDAGFLEIIDAFKKYLESCDILFISGFGFNDIKIATTLNAWLYDTKKDRLVVRMYEASGFNRNYMKAFYHKSLRDSPLLQPVEECFKLRNGVIDIGKFMQNTTLEDLEAAFNNNEVKHYLGL